jgi:hypothetical protein
MIKEVLGWNGKRRRGRQKVVRIRCSCAGDGESLYQRLIKEDLLKATTRLQVTTSGCNED